jgi:hypothetical protein
MFEGLRGSGLALMWATPLTLQNPMACFNWPCGSLYRAISYTPGFLLAGSTPQTSRSPCARSAVPMSAGERSVSFKRPFCRRREQPNRP